jgi:acetyl-CoA C-acetyltransferase
MPEAVIVSYARSPIGRAFKGSLKEMRSDDLATQVIAAALAKVPGLDPGEIGDLILGCGLPVANKASTWRATSRSNWATTTCRAPR